MNGSIQKVKTVNHTIPKWFSSLDQILVQLSKKEESFYKSMYRQEVESKIYDVKSTTAATTYSKKVDEKLDEISQLQKITTWISSVHRWVLEKKTLESHSQSNIPIIEKPVFYIEFLSKLKRNTIVPFVSYDSFTNKNGTISLSKTMQRTGELVQKTPSSHMLKTCQNISRIDLLYLTLYHLYLVHVSWNKTIISKKSDGQARTQYLANVLLRWNLGCIVQSSMFSFSMRWYTLSKLYSVEHCSVVVPISFLHKRNPLESSPLMDSKKVEKEIQDDLLIENRWFSKNPTLQKYLMECLNEIDVVRYPTLSLESLREKNIRLKMSKYDESWRKKILQFEQQNNRSAMQSPTEIILLVASYVHFLLSIWESGALLSNPPENHNSITEIPGSGGLSEKKSLYDAKKQDSKTEHRYQSLQQRQWTRLQIYRCFLIHWVFPLLMVLYRHQKSPMNIWREQLGLPFPYESLKNPNESYSSAKTRVKTGEEENPQELLHLLTHDHGQNSHKSVFRSLDSKKVDQERLQLANAILQLARVTHLHSLATFGQIRRMISLFLHLETLFSSPEQTPMWCFLRKLLIHLNLISFS